MSFFETLEARVDATGSLLCVGLDPRVGTAAEAREACLRLIDLTAPQASAFKPNSAFFEALGPDGIQTLADVIAAVPDGIPVVLDAKRGDIGPTAAAYAVAAFDVAGATAVTLSPYLGLEALGPFLDRGDAFVLCRTSNPGGDEFQEARSTGGEAAYLAVARAVAAVAPQKVGLVVGATRPEAISRVRAIAPEHWILAPGVGAQGGSLEAAVAAGLRSDGAGVLIPVSRAISAADDPGAAAAQLVDRMRRVGSRPVSAPPATLADALFDAGCIRFGDFELKSGRRSPIYVDLRTLSGHPGVLQQVARRYVPLVGADEGHRLAGVPLAGLPIATAVALESGIPMVYPRPGPKDHGTRSSVEGPYQLGDRVVVVDDVATTGISVIVAAQQLRDVGLVVDTAVVLIERGGGAAGALAAEGIELRSVFDLVGLVAALEASGRITPEQRDRAESFLGG